MCSADCKCVSYVSTASSNDIVRIVSVVSIVSNVHVSKVSIMIVNKCICCS